MKLDANPPAIVRSAVDLQALATEINAAHRAGQASIRCGLEQFQRAGEALLNAKAACGHGQWQDWLKKNVRFSERQARRYMALARKPADSDLEEYWKSLLGHDGTEVKTDAGVRFADEPEPKTDASVRFEDEPEPVEPDHDANSCPANKPPAADAGSGIPERLKRIFDSVPHLKTAAARAETAANAFEVAEQTPAFQKANEGTKPRLHSTTIRAAARAIKAITPRRPCPCCGGEFEPSMDNDPCKTCMDRGYQTDEEVTAEEGGQ